MLKIASIFFLISFFIVSCSTMPNKKTSEVGIASWYGANLKGHRTANGERFDPRKFTAAHRTLPFGTYVLVRSRANGKTVRVRINDRGPFADGRIIDLSYAAAARLGFISKGEDEVEITPE